MACGPKAPQTCYNADMLGIVLDFHGYSQRRSDHGSRLGSSGLDQTALTSQGCLLCGDLEHYRIDFLYVIQKNASLVTLREDRSQYHILQDGLEVEASSIIFIGMVLGAPLLCLSDI